MVSKTMDLAVLLLPFLIASFGPSSTFAALEDVAFCGDCFCIPDPGEDCPTSLMPQVEYSEEVLNKFRSITHENPITLDCDPFQDTACDTVPPLQTGEVCIAEITESMDGQCPGDYSYRLRTFFSRDIAAASGLYITHDGPCGVCSSFQDLAVYIDMPDLSGLGIGCGPRVLGDFADGTACFMEAGFSEPCATLWASNVLATNAACITSCLPHAFSGNPNNGPPPGCELVECIQCDEDSAGPIFNRVAGRTRRNSGLLSGIVRGCGELSNITHFDPCEASLFRILCENSLASEELTDGLEFGTECECIGDDNNNVLLSCMDTLCLGCNNDKSICAEFTFGSNFGVDFSVFSQVTYVKGLSGELRYTETDAGCQIEVNGVPCSQCSFTTCDDGGEGFDGIIVECENIMSAPDLYSSCDLDFTTDGPFQVFSATSGFDECVGPGEISCQRVRESVEQFGQVIGSRCECLVDEEEVVTLCSDTICEYCCTDGSVCGQVKYGQVFDLATGEQIGTSGGARYVSGGRSEEIQVLVDERDATCSIIVDGVECTSCDVIDCGGSSFGELEADIVCTNVADGSDYNSCNPTDTDGGVLQLFNEDYFEVCIPRATSFVEDACAVETSATCSCVESDVPGSPVMGGRFNLECEKGELCFCENGNDVAGNEVCSSHMSIKTFDPPLGSVSMIEDVVTYSRGRDDEIRVLLDRCADHLGVACPFEYSCSMEVNGVQCNSCALCAEYNRVGFGIEGITPNLSFDCSNIESGATFDLCSGSPPSPSADSAFRFLLDDICEEEMCEGIFSRCSDPSDCCSGRCFLGFCRGVANRGKTAAKVGKNRGGAAGRAGAQRSIRGL